jgi:hypothetical protein
LWHPTGASNHADQTAQKSDPNVSHNRWRAWPVNPWLLTAVVAVAMYALSVKSVKVWCDVCQILSNSFAQQSKHFIKPPEIL